MHNVLVACRSITRANGRGLGLEIETLLGLLNGIEPLKVHKIEIFFGFDFENCTISLLFMSKY